MEQSPPTAAALIAMIVGWFQRRADLQALALVGSYARGAARPDSDIDLVLLVDDPRRYRDERAWVEQLPWATLGTAVRATRDADYGPLWSRFVTLTAGPEVEFGFASPRWASARPIDPGTFKVVSDGCQPLYDPAGLVDQLLATVRRARETESGS